MAGNKVFFIVGGKGLKPDQDYRYVDPGKFTKGSTGRKPIPATKTRINKSLGDNTLRDVLPGEWPNT